MSKEELEAIWLEIERIIENAKTLSGLQADDFQTLHTMAETAEAWEDKLEYDIVAVLQSNANLQRHAEHYLGGNIKAWINSLFHIHDEQAFFKQQIEIACAHIEHGVSTEIVLGLVPRWLELIKAHCQNTLTSSEVEAIMLVFTRILNIVAILTVTFQDMIVRRTLLYETGFSEKLLHRLQTRTLSTLRQKVLESF